MKLICLSALFNLFLFYSSNAQKKPEATPKTIPLLKVIKDRLAPDSNTVFINYDSKFNLASLTEYIKRGGAWSLINKMVYNRDKDGNVINIHWDIESNPHPEHGILLANGGNTYNILYDERKRIKGRKYASYTTGFQRYDYNKDSLIIREVSVSFKDSTIDSYWEYDHDTLGRDIASRRFLVRNFRATKQLDYSQPTLFDTMNSVSDPFYIDKYHNLVFSPIRLITLSYINNVIGKNTEIQYNANGFPEIYMYAGSETQPRVEYLINYIYPPNDISWENYQNNSEKEKWSKKNEPYTKIFINPNSRIKKRRAFPFESNAQIDLRNGVPMTIRELASMQTPHVINSGSGLKSPIGVYQSTANNSATTTRPGYRSTFVHTNAKQFVVLFSEDRSYVHVYNQSSYPFIVHVSNYNDLFLTPKSGAFYYKKDISDSAKVSIEYADSDFILRQKAIIYEMKKFGGEMKATNASVDFALESVLNRERIPSPTIIWTDEYGRFLREEKPDPIQDAMTDFAVDLLSMAAAGYAKENLEQNRIRLVRSLQDNQDVFEASKGIKNKYESFFSYNPMKYYTTIKLRDLNER